MQLCQGIDKKHIPYKLPSKVIDWKTNWFFVGNYELSLPERTSGPPMIYSKWILTGRNLDQVKDLLVNIVC